MGPNASIENLTINNLVSGSTDLYIFSSAIEYSEEDHLRWFHEEKYDACYRINSARLFFRAISRRFAEKGKLLGFGPIHYAPSIDIKNPLALIHPAMVKRQTVHSTQREIRAVWALLREGVIEPELVTCPEAWRYCELHRIIRDGRPVRP